MLLYRPCAYIFFCSSLLSILLVSGFFPVPVSGEVQPQRAWAGKNVLILHAFEPNMPIFEITDRGIRAALESGGIAIQNQFYEYLDLRRNPGREYKERL